MTTPVPLPDFETVRVKVWRDTVICDETREVFSSLSVTFIEILYVPGVAVQAKDQLVVPVAVYQVVPSKDISTE